MVTGGIPGVSDQIGPGKDDCKSFPQNGLADVAAGMGRQEKDCDVAAVRGACQRHATRT